MSWGALMIDECFHVSCRFLLVGFLGDDEVESRSVEAPSPYGSGSGFFLWGSVLCTSPLSPARLLLDFGHPVRNCPHPRGVFESRSFPFSMPP